MPKDLIAPSQQWNTQDQFEQSKIINTQNEQDKLKKLQNEQDFNSLAEKEQKAWEKLKKYEADGYDMSMHYDKFKTIGADSGKVERAYNGFRKFTSEGATTLSNILNEDDSQYRNNVREVKLREDNWKQRQSELNPNEYKTKEDVWNVAGGVGEVTPYVAGGVAMGVSKAPTFLGKLAGDIGRGAVADAYLGTLQHGYKENFDSEIAKEVGLGVAGQTVGTGLAHLLSKVGVGDVLTPKNPQTEVTDKINKEYASSSVENKVGDSISSSDNITPDSVAKKINDTYFGGKNIIPDAAPVRSDMPVVDNQQASKVNDFFNPVDKNRVEVQGNTSLPTPASQQDPFVYQPKQADTFGWEKDAQRNNELQQLREKISPLNDILKINETKSLMGVKRENPNDISLPPMGTQKQLLPDVLPTDKQEMLDVMQFAKDNNAVDEFISKLPSSARIDEVKQAFDKMPISQPKETNVLPAMSPIEPRQTKSGILYSNGGQNLGGAFAGGAESEFNQRDYTQDGTHDYKDNIVGALVGILGVQGAKKIFPKAFEDKNLNSDVMGAFVSKADKQEKRGIYNVTFNDKLKTNIKESNLQDVVEYEKGNRRYGANHIIRKHLGDGKTGELSKEDILDFGKVVKEGNIDENSFKQLEDGISYTYSLNKDGYKLSIAVKETNDGKKILSGFSNKNFIDNKKTDGITLDQPSVINESISNNIPKSQDIKLNASPTIGGGMVGGITGAGNDINQDGKTDAKDILYGALGGAGIGKGASYMVNKQNISSAIERVKNSDFANNMYHFRIDKQKDYMKSREAAQREINKTMQEAEELHFALKELPEQDRKNMYKYMTGESVGISETQKSLIDNVREKITELGKKLVDEKILDEKAFEDWKDVYIHRNYEKHLFKGLKENVSRAFNDTKTLQPIYKRGKVSTIANNDIHAAIEMMSDAGYFKKNDAINIKSMDELVELSKAIPISKGGVDFKKLPDGKFEIRRDWTKAEREKMGEIEDVAFAIPETISRLQELVSHAKFLKEVPENVIGDTSKFTPEELKNSGFIKLDGARYGALNGKFVQKDIARDIGMVSRQLMGSDFQWERLYSEYLTMFKKSHTVYNPSAHINNMTSNITLQYMEGVNPQDIAKNIKNSIGVVDKVQKVKELKAKTKLYELPSDKKELDMLLGDKDVKLWYDAEANGLFGRSELNDVLMRYANKGEDNNKGLSGLLKNLAGNKTSTIAEKADRFASNLYQHEDNFNRFTLLKYFVNDKKMNLEDAISKVNTVIPDYTKPMARVPDWLRRTGVTPFVAWTYYATPILMRQMKEHPARAMALVGLMYGSYASNGINPFDEKDMPQDGWAFKRVPLPFGASTDGSKVTTVKVDKAMPHMELLNMFKPSDNMFVPQFIKDQLSGGIPQSLISWMFNYNPYFNTKITYSNDTGAKAYHLGKHFVQNLLPTPDILDSAYNLGETAVLSKEVRKTQKAVEPRTQTENILKSLGINLMTYDKQKQKKKVIDDEIKRIKDKKP